MSFIGRLNYLKATIASSTTIKHLQTKQLSIQPFNQQSTKQPSNHPIYYQIRQLSKPSMNLASTQPSKKSTNYPCNLPTTQSTNNPANHYYY